MKFLALIMFLLCSTAQALTLEPTLPNPQQEQRAQEIFQEIRCMVCNGQSIADSRAELAGNLREIIRSKITEGYSEKQVLDYLVTRYGDGILMQPPLAPATYLLWLGPLIILLAGLIIMLVYLRGRKVGVHH